MSLDFQFVPTIDRALIEYRNKDNELHWLPRAQSFVFFQMQLQHDLTGEMTGKKLQEIYRRISLINQTEHRAYYWDKEGNGYQHQLHDVVTYWGLWTNVSHRNKRDWNKWFMKMLELNTPRIPIHQLSTQPYEVYIKAKVNAKSD